MTEQEMFSKDEVLKSFYIERAEQVKKVNEIDKKIMIHIQETYPDVERKIKESMKRANLYKQGFKKRSRYK